MTSTTQAADAERQAPAHGWWPLLVIGMPAAPDSPLRTGVPLPFPVPPQSRAPGETFIGLFNGTPDLAERSEEILREEFAKRRAAARALIPGFSGLPPPRLVC